MKRDIPAGKVFGEAVEGAGVFDEGAGVFKKEVDDAD